MADDYLRMVMREGSEHLVLRTTLTEAEARKSMASSNRKALLEPGRCWMRIDGARRWIIYDYFSPETN